MKNIHVLKTNKPSRLTRALHYNNSLRLVHKNYKCDVKDEQYQNMYITSDEEIKEGDKYLHYWYENEVSKDKTKIIISSADINTNNKKERVSYLGKIILTTDQDLIKDGVQAIDDEFLEWFVKNPTCEFLEVEDVYKTFLEGDSKSVSNFRNRYKIIVPKEEPKKKCILCHRYPQLEGIDKCESCYSVIRHSLEQDPMFKDSLLPDVRKTKQECICDSENDKWVCTINCKNKESKQETLENDTDSQEWGFENFISSEEDAKIFTDAIIKHPEPNEKLKNAFREYGKQETVEEAAMKMYPIKTDPSGYDINMFSRYGFYNGAKWQVEKTIITTDDAYSEGFENGKKHQAERMYSEEEVLNLLFEYSCNNENDKEELKEWFEQFKKK